MPEVNVINKKKTLKKLDSPWSTWMVDRWSPPFCSRSHQAQSSVQRINAQFASHKHLYIQNKAYGSLSGHRNIVSNTKRHHITFFFYSHSANAYQKTKKKLKTTKGPGSSLTIQIRLKRRPATTTQRLTETMKQKKRKK